MSRTLRSLSLTAAVVLCLLLSAAGYAQTVSRLSGSVLDATGLPLAGTTVTLRGAGDDVTQTDAQGEFPFQGLRSGEYELPATLRGLAAATRTIRLAAGELTRISFTLEVQFLEQTVVTASRTGETGVQATPLAISVLTGAQLARMQDYDVEQVASRAPGVTFSQNTGLAQLTIRGIGTNAV